MGVLEDMLQKHACGKSRLRVIEIIWSVTDPGEGPMSQIFGIGMRKLTGVAN
jgi:hypothetical protein